MGITKRRKQPHLYRTDARHAAADHVTVSEATDDSTDELTTSGESVREALQRLDEVSDQLGD